MQVLKRLCFAPADQVLQNRQHLLFDPRHLGSGGQPLRLPQVEYIIHANLICILVDVSFCCVTTWKRLVHIANLFLPNGAWREPSSRSKILNLLHLFCPLFRRVRISCNFPGVGDEG